MRTARHESQPSQLQSTGPAPGHRVEQQGEQLSLRRSSRSGVQISLLDNAPKHSHVFTRDATNVDWGGFAAHSPASAAQPPLQLPRQQPSSNKQVPTRTQSNIHCLAAAGVALCVRQQHRVERGPCLPSQHQSPSSCLDRRCPPPRHNLGCPQKAKRCHKHTVTTAGRMLQWYVRNVGLQLLGEHKSGIRLPSVPSLQEHPRELWVGGGCGAGGLSSSDGRSL